MSTESDAAWAEVERAAISRISGATAEDDDALAAGAIGEAMLNPNRQGGGAGQGMGGPGMMPPMMGMGGGGGGGSGSSGGDRGFSAPLTPTPVQPQSSASIPLSTAVAAAEAKPQTTMEGPEMPSGLGGGGLGGGDMGGGDMGGGDMGGGADRPAGGTGTGGDQAPADGFAADPVLLRGIASKWASLSQELHTLTGRTALDAHLGIPMGAERPQQAVNQQVAAWCTGAAVEFDALVARLHEVAEKYEAAEESGAAEARRGTRQ